MVVPNNVLAEKEDEWMKSLWDEIQKANANKEGKGKAPLGEIDLEKELVKIEIASRYQAIGPITFQLSKASTFKELPFFVGDYRSDNDVRKVPSQYKPSPIVLDIANLQVLLSTPMREGTSKHRDYF